MHAQTTILTHAGEYYLQGEMEMAAGFKLNKDHSFDFFFSYGALDRQAEGTWTIVDSKIVLNSRKSSSDFSLVDSKKTEENGLLINMLCSNPQLNEHFFALLTANGQTDTAQADNSGIIRFATKKADSITLFFEMCPEKKFVFSLKDLPQNVFSFRVEPTLFDVRFEKFSMHITQNEISGPLPFSGDHVCRFKRKH